MSSSSPPRKNDFQADFPARFRLNSDQFKHCSEALAFFKNKLQNPHQIEQEFITLKANSMTLSEMTRSCTVALDGVNFGKNRYEDVLPFDKNRIVLNQGNFGHSSGDYINASPLEISPSESIKKFIATQGPLPETYVDFWEMVIQCRCPAVVMLTQLVDNKSSRFKIIKCGDYFQAEEGPREFGNIHIVTKWIKYTKTSLVLRHLEVSEKESAVQPLSVLHIHYPEWPDHGLPEDTLAVREIVRRINQVESNLGPTLVHCSAGIGRTGTYCTIHNTIQRILVGDMSALNLLNTITTFRSQRFGIVETEDQYFFCHRAIADELEDLIQGFNAKSTFDRNNDTERHERKRKRT